ncbi:DUF4270 domain-containing protein, partial [Odoribacter sp. OttesenSCG-928-J03]|nr:DUF4270 domain-containing protein [Odoribacter sp. OttesenSCG-928-J03]
VDAAEYKIYNTYTIKLDSFPANEAKDAQKKDMAMGRIYDPISGVTKAIPYVTFEPSVIPVIERYYIYDSITLDLGIKENKIWGDTSRVQKFYIHQTQEIPAVNSYDSYIYNIRQTPYDATPLDSFKFLPRSAVRGKMSFRLNDTLGLELYNLVKTRDLRVTNSINFLKYFKGWAFVADDENNSIVNLYANADTFNICIHYHENVNRPLKYNFNKSEYYNSFIYTNTQNDATGTPFSVLTDQQQSLSIGEAKTALFPYGQAISQGLNGYMIKMRLPIEPSNDRYKTIVKAEIILKTPYNSNAGYFHDLSKVYLYSSDKENRLQGLVTVNNEFVTGSLHKDPMNPDESKYVVNITDYYNLLCKNPNANDNNHIVIGISSDDLASSFDRMIINEIPILKVYYAKYE